MHAPTPGALIVILLIVVLLFGAKKIPELAKGLGSGIKNFKKAVKEEDEDNKQDDKGLESTQTHIKQTNENSPTSKTDSQKQEA